MAPQNNITAQTVSTIDLNAILLSAATIEATLNSFPVRAVASPVKKRLNLKSEKRVVDIIGRSQTIMVGPETIDAAVPLEIIPHVSVISLSPLSSCEPVIAQPSAMAVALRAEMAARAK